MKIQTNTMGGHYVSVRDMHEWLLRIEDDIRAECASAPDGCTETRAYLYGEICALRMLRIQVANWVPADEPASADTP